jgi:hypothetical protein
MESELQMLSRHDASPRPQYNVLLLGDEACQSRSARWFSYSVIRKFLTSSQGYILRYKHSYLDSVSRIRSVNLARRGGVVVVVDAL